MTVTDSEHCPPCTWLIIDYNVEVVPAMKAFFISLGILETFTNQVSIGNKIKVRRTEEKI